MASRATPDDVRTMAAFPGEDVVPDQTIQRWLDMRAGELNLLLTRKGVDPEAMDAPDFEQTLRLAEVYGAAAMMGSAELQGVDHERIESLSRTYLGEYTRIYNQISGITRDDLVRLGILTINPALSSGLGQGLAVAGNRHVDAHYNDWRAYPLRAD
jgi:hypothetical protein